MIQRAQQNPTPETPDLTRDELWYLGFLQFAEETIAQGKVPSHSRPLSFICPVQESLAAKGLVRFEGPRVPIPRVVLTDAGRAIDAEALARREQPGIQPDAVPEMEVCHACAQVVGRFYRSHFGYRVQYGRCRDHTMPEGAYSDWPRYDYNLHVDLCRCCGRVPLSSGSKYSVWFCNYCKQQVGLLNGRHNRCVIPVGRHSFHAGYMLRMDEETTPADILLFTEGVNSIFQVHGPLEEWAREAVRLNLRACGWEEDAVVPLPAYWEAVVRQGIHPRERFGQMCEYLAAVGRGEAP